MIIKKKTMRKYKSFIDVQINIIYDGMKSLSSSLAKSQTKNSRTLLTIVRYCHSASACIAMGGDKSVTFLV